MPCDVVLDPARSLAASVNRSYSRCMKRAVCAILAALLATSTALTTGAGPAVGQTASVISTSVVTIGRVGDLRDGGTVVVSGQGFNPNVAVQWFTCALGVFCDVATVGGGVTDSAGSFSQLYVTRRFLAAHPEIDCAQVACSLVGFEVPSFDSPFNVALRFPSRFPRFQYRVELTRTGSVDAGGVATIGVRARCTYVTDFTIQVRATQRDASGAVVASGSSAYHSVRCWPDPKRGRVVNINVDSSLPGARPFASGPVEVMATGVVTSTAGEPAVTLLRTIDLK